MTKIWPTCPFTKHISSSYLIRLLVHYIFHQHQYCIAELLNVAYVAITTWPTLYPCVKTARNKMFSICHTMVYSYLSVLNIHLDACVAPMLVGPLRKCPLCMNDMITALNQTWDIHHNLIACWVWSIDVNDLPRNIYCKRICGTYCHRLLFLHIIYQFSLHIFLWKAYRCVLGIKAGSVKIEWIYKVNNEYS